MVCCGLLQYMLLIRRNSIAEFCIDRKYIYLNEWHTTLHALLRGLLFFFLLFFLLLVSNSFSIVIISLNRSPIITITHSENIKIFCNFSFWNMILLRVEVHRLINSFFIFVFFFHYVEKKNACRNACCWLNFIHLPPIYLLIYTSILSTKLLIFNKSLNWNSTLKENIRAIIVYKLHELIALHLLLLCNRIWDYQREVRLWKCDPIVSGSFMMFMLR